MIKHLIPLFLTSYLSTAYCRMFGSKYWSVKSRFPVQFHNTNVGLVRVQIIVQETHSWEINKFENKVSARVLMLPIRDHIYEALVSKSRMVSTQHKKAQIYVFRML
jgi:hypothetical protein